jgi:hypothetical protein
MEQYEDIPNGTKYKRISGDIWDSPSDGKSNALNWYDNPWKVYGK